jgi:predicted metal-dependent phosphotriesterase family hydrolase
MPNLKVCMKIFKITLWLFFVWLMPNSWKYRRWVIGGNWVKVRKIEMYGYSTDSWRHEPAKEFLDKGYDWRLSSDSEVELEKEYYPSKIY